MRSIYIVSRLKDSNGRVSGYEVIIDSKYRAIMTEDRLHRVNNLIQNAILTESGEYRAKNGNRIVSKVDKMGLGAVKSDGIKRVDDIGTDIDTMNKIVSNALGKEYIKKCIEVRNSAIGGCIEVETKVHRVNNGRNVQLFKLIEECGISVDEFVRGYLSIVQPYSLMEFKGKNSDSRNNWWVKDEYYRYSMIIKVHNKVKDKMVDKIVVSFHESNRDGILQSGKFSEIDGNSNVVILVNKVNKNSNGRYEVKYYVQRGMLRLKCKSETSFYRNGIAVIKYKEIQERIEEIVNRVVREIEDEYGAEGSIKVSNNRVSFLSYGATYVNQVCMLIDKYSDCTDKRDKKIIADVVENIVCNLEENVRQGLEVGLRVRFSGRDVNGLYGVIMSSLKGS